MLPLPIPPADLLSEEISGSENQNREAKRYLDSESGKEKKRNRQHSLVNFFKIQISAIVLRVCGRLRLPAAIFDVT